MVLKPSELSAETAKLFDKIIPQYLDKVMSSQMCFLLVILICSDTYRENIAQMHYMYLCLQNIKDFHQTMGHKDSA